MIPARDLSLLSNRLAAGGRRLPETVLERDYCLAWFLVALARTPLREALVFKGGTALKRCWFGDYRSSEDLDFTLAREMDFETLKAGLEPVYAEAARATGALFRFSRADRNSHANGHTFYLAYEGPLPAPAGGREVKVDVTIGERLVHPVAERPVLRAYPEFRDLTEEDRVLVYALEEIASEKVVALLDRARNEPRDLYDIWFLAEEGHVELPEVAGAVEEKLVFRGKRLEDVREELARKEARLRKLWSIRLAGQVVRLPEFEGVWRAVRRAFRQAGFGPK